MTVNDLDKKASEIRRRVVNVSLNNGAGHIAPSLSCVEILTCLYYKYMNYRPDEPNWEGRDRLVFSKAHGAYALYAILADVGLMPDEQWQNFYTDKSLLKGCLERRMEFGIEASCGALGHGLPMAVGMAYAAKLQKRDNRVFCILGDGELQEGSAWEAVQFAVKYRLNNLVLLVDRNRLQAMDFVADVLDNDPQDIYNRFSGFGLEPISCEGHECSAVSSGIEKALLEKEKPALIIAETVKGCSCKCMEDVPKFHFRMPSCQGLRNKKL